MPPSLPPPPLSSMVHFPPLLPSTNITSHRIVPSVTTKNRFSILDEIDLVEEIHEKTSGHDMTTVNSLTIGDSLVRGLGKHLAKNKSKSSVLVYPGANIKFIENKINKNHIPQINSCLVVSTGSNDIFHKKVASEIVIQQYMNLIDTIKDRADNAIIVGVLPRMKVGGFALSRAIGINERVKKLCKEAKIGYLDPWQDFIGNRKYYLKDGIHLSNDGTKLLAALIESHLQSGIFF